MKCPKCGYHSFEHLDSCRKCDHNLHEHKAKYKLRGFLTPGTAATTTPPDAEEEESAATPASAGSESSDFGFDFLEDDEDRTGAGNASFAGNDHEINLDQPFDVDSETIPADVPATEKSKRDKDSKFAF